MKYQDSLEILKTFSNEEYISVTEDDEAREVIANLTYDTMKLFRVSNDLTETAKVLIELYKLAYMHARRTGVDLSSLDSTK